MPVRAKRWIVYTVLGVLISTVGNLELPNGEDDSQMVAVVPRSQIQGIVATFLVQRGLETHRMGWLGLGRNEYRCESCF
jgi:hypothetical protein